MKTYTFTYPRWLAQGEDVPAKLIGQQDGTDASDAYFKLTGKELVVKDPKDIYPEQVLVGLRRLGCANISYTDQDGFTIIVEEV